MSENLEQYKAVAAAFGEQVGAVSDWTAPSECEGWTARDVVAHVVYGHRRVLANIDGGEPAEVGPDDDPAAAWRDTHQEVTTRIADPTVCATVIQGPFGPIPVEDAFGGLLAFDTMVHTWDLGHAVGRDVRLSPATVERCQATLGPLDDGIRGPGFFGTKLTPPDGADAQTALLYFLGRQA
jgi:uncharacterized protein (TIGR03086 family)